LRRGNHGVRDELEFHGGLGAKAERVVYQLLGER
jgi:hypothetical protein